MRVIYELGRVLNVPLCNSTVLKLSLLGDDPASAIFAHVVTDIVLVVVINDNCSFVSPLNNSVVDSDIRIMYCVLGVRVIATDGDGAM